jgi:hypothetical protein
MILCCHRKIFSFQIEPGHAFDMAFGKCSAIHRSLCTYFASGFRWYMGSIGLGSKIYTVLVSLSRMNRINSLLDCTGIWIWNTLDIRSIKINNLEDTYREVFLPICMMKHYIWYQASYERNMLAVPHLTSFRNLDVSQNQ